jgi:hypothetical protein
LRESVHRRRPSPDTPLDFESVGKLRYYVPHFKREFDYALLGQVLKLRLASALAEAHVEYLTRFSRGYAVASFLALNRFAEFATAGQNGRTGLKQVNSVHSGAGADAWREAVSAHVVKLE